MKFNKSFFLMIVFVSNGMLLGMSRVPNLSINAPTLNQSSFFSLQKGAFRSTPVTLFQATMPGLISFTEALNLLELNENATKQEIKAAFYNKAKLNHPDVSGGSTQKMQQLNEALGIALKNAKNVLSSHVSENENITPVFADTSWIHALAFGDLNKVKLYLKNGYSPNRQFKITDNQYGVVLGLYWPPLAWALFNLKLSKSIQVAEELIHAGANVNGFENCTSTTLGKLLKATTIERVQLPDGDRLRLVKLMINHNVNLNFSTYFFEDNNRHALFYVVREGKDLELLNLLLNFGSISGENDRSNGYNLVHTAIACAQDEKTAVAMVDALLKAGSKHRINFDEKCNNKDTPLDLAKKKNNIEVVRLLKAAEFNERSDFCCC